MKPEQILQSHLLDIVFDNRNKAYGAYALRKEYNSRLAKAIAITFLTAALFWAVNYVSANIFKDKSDVMPPIDVTDVVIAPPPAEVKKPDQPPALKVNPKQFEQVNNTPPIIVDDKQVDKTLPDIAKLETANISNIDKAGDAVESGPAVPASNGDGNGVAVKQEASQPAEVEITTPLLHADIMPEFPGGSAAFMKFMLRNLKEPDLEPGQKVVVPVKFVVLADGSISASEIINSGGSLDAEVMRVINKMPKWKPGMQHGRAVPVYFTLPVTFLGNEN